MIYNNKFKNTKAKYDPYMQRVRDDIAKMYWSMRKENRLLANLTFKHEQHCFKLLKELIWGHVLNVR